MGLFVYTKLNITDTLTFKACDAYMCWQLSKTVGFACTFLDNFVKGMGVINWPFPL